MKRNVLYFANYGKDTRHLSNCKSFELLKDAKKHISNNVNENSYSEAYNITRMEFNNDSLQTLKSKKIIIEVIK